MPLNDCVQGHVLLVLNQACLAQRDAFIVYDQFVFFDRVGDDLGRQVIGDGIPAVADPLRRST